jgi:hypothetical protein
MPSRLARLNVAHDDAELTCAIDRLQDRAPSQVAAPCPQPVNACVKKAESAAAPAERA